MATAEATTGRGISGNNTAASTAANCLEASEERLPRYARSPGIDPAQVRAHGVLDIAMAKPRLQCPCIVARIGQGVAAGVPEHVRVDWECHSCPFAEPRNQGMEALGAHGPAPLRGEHMRPWWLLAL